MNPQTTNIRIAIKLYIIIDVVGSARGLITLGVRIFRGLHQKNLKDLETCLKFCINAGGGVAQTPDDVATNPMVCFGIDWDFEEKKCWHHFDEGLCVDTDPVTTPVRMTPSVSGINILVCKYFKIFQLTLFLKLSGVIAQIY